MVVLNRTDAAATQQAAVAALEQPVREFAAARGACALSPCEAAIFNGIAGGQPGEVP